MLKVLTTILSLLLLFSSLKAQQQAEQLNKWSEVRPIEKVYIHYDRTEHFPGQTIWFKAYLYSEYVPSTQSTSLYVEFFNPASRMIARQVYPIFGGFARGQIELPDTLKGGKYMLRAYTPGMLESNPEYIYQRQLTILGKNDADNSIADVKQTMLEFFPEGGSFVTGLSNTIAFKITDGAGFPLDGSGSIMKDDGTILETFKSLHDGMGYFDLTPEEGLKYYAVLDGNAENSKHYLPAHSKKGIVFRILTSGNAKQFEIMERGDDPDFTASYMIGQMQHRVVFTTKFPEDRKSAPQGTIRTEDLPSGIMQVTVFNKHGMPLAERLTFINNKEYILDGTLSLDTIGISPREYNSYTISMKDTVVGSFSVSVYDADFDDRAAREENIFSGLLLTSDLRGYIHNPAWYFNTDEVAYQDLLDLVMMTNGWRRFEWKELPKLAGMKKDERSDFISLSGKVMLEGTKKPFAEKELMALIQPVEGKREVKMAVTDKEGNFHIDSILFFERARIFFSDIRGRKNKYIDVNVGSDSITREYKLPDINFNDYPNDRAKRQLLMARMQAEYADALKADGEMLDEVVIKGKKKSRVEEFEEKYVSTMFSGEPVRRLEFFEEDLGPYANIFDYLSMRVPGVTIVPPNYMDSDGPAGYGIFFRQGPTVSSMGSIPMTIFLDEVQTSPDVVATIPANQIAMVKVFSNFAGAPGGGAGGAMAIYTKRGQDLANTMPTGGVMLSAPGYTVSKQFYSPDYSGKKKDSRPDNRITLYWNSGYLVAGANPKLAIRFYNNDRTKRFRVIVEGMTAEGRMLLIDRVVVAQKAF